MVSAAGLAAVVLVAGGNKQLLDNLGATDSGTRFRAVYALARTYDPSDQAESDAVYRLVTGGLPAERKAVVDGLLARRREGPPASLMGAVPELVPRKRSVECIPDPYAAEDPLRRVPFERAREILGRQGWAGGEIDCWEKGGDKTEIRAWYERTGKWSHARLELKSPSAAATMRGPNCLESCLDELALLAWLGMPVETVLSRRKPPTIEIDWWTQLLFHRIEAAADEARLESLAAEVPRIQDGTKRRILFRALVRTPGREIPRAMRRIVVDRVDDPHHEIRKLAIEVLSTRAEMIGEPGAAAALVIALRDDDPDNRIRAATGLFDLAPLDDAQSHGVLAHLKQEHDGVVQAVLISALQRRR